MRLVQARMPPMMLNVRLEFLGPDEPLSRPAPRSTQPTPRDPGRCPWISHYSRVLFYLCRLDHAELERPHERRSEAVALLRRAVESGIDQVGTAEFYGLGFAHDVIREALRP